MSLGPVEYVLVEFPGNKFKGEIVPALEELVGNGTIRIIDLIFITKDTDGSVISLELSTLPEEEAAVFESVGLELGDLLTQEDVEIAAEALAPGNSAALLVWENTWAARFAASVRGADGRLIAHDRIPAEAVEIALAAAAAGDN
jgi:hypothetical protein